MARTSGGKGSSRARGGVDDRLRQIDHCDHVRGRGAGGVHDLGRRAEADYFGSRDVRADLPADVLEGVLEEDCPKWPAKQPAPAAMQRYRCTKAYARGETSATGQSAETRHRRMRAFWLGNMSVSASATARHRHWVAGNRSNPAGCRLVHVCLVDAPQARKGAITGHRQPEGLSYA